MTRIAIFLAAAVVASAANAVERQVRVEIGGLTCPSCPYIAASALRSVESVDIVEAYYDVAAQKAVFLLSYDDDLTTPDIIAGSTMEYGYPGRVLDPALEP